jgi:hypothetical protein
MQNGDMLDSDMQNSDMEEKAHGTHVAQLHDVIIFASSQEGMSLSPMQQSCNELLVRRLIYEEFGPSWAPCRLVSVWLASGFIELLHLVLRRRMIAQCFRA